MKIDYGMCLQDCASTSDPVVNPQAEPVEGAGGGVVSAGRSYVPRGFRILEGDVENMERQRPAKDACG